MNTELQTKILSATRGSKFGAILACALGVDRDAIPRFEGKAIITSDGFAMCNFVDSRGEGHHGAFVGSWDDVENNVAGLSRHLNLKDKDAAALANLVASWRGQDYRDRRAVR